VQAFLRKIFTKNQELFLLSKFLFFTAFLFVFKCLSLFCKVQNTMSIQKAVIIVAGGQGLRMQTDIPKQFIELFGKPILMHTIANFHRFDNEMQLILVLPPSHLKFWSELCEKYRFEIKHTVVAGGDTRFQSVLNGLQQLANVEIVAIHDGVRPLVSHETIKRCFAEANKYGAVIPVVDCVESVREVTMGVNRSVDRSHFKLVQTPQIFEKKLLLEAYKQPFSTLFTDDASVVESSGRQISLVEGNRENIKITTQFDLKIAEIFLKEAFEK
jgi:2-C-methyl-D-erythritol 4-phosphate cytidylyltransferase